VTERIAPVRKWLFISGTGGFFHRITHFIREHIKQASYYITDMAKGAMFTKDAIESYIGRWIRWYPLLIDELKNVVHPKTKVFALGEKVFSALYYSNTQAILGLETRIKGLTHYANRFPRAPRRLSKKIEAKYKKVNMQAFAKLILKDTGADSKLILHISNRIKNLNDADIELLGCWEQEFASD